MGLDHKIRVLQLWVFFLIVNKNFAEDELFCGDFFASSLPLLSSKGMKLAPKPLEAPLHVPRIKPCAGMEAIG